MGDNENTIRSGALKKTSFRLDFSEPSAKTRGEENAPGKGDWRLHKRRMLQFNLCLTCFLRCNSFLPFFPPPFPLSRADTTRTVSSFCIFLNIANLLLRKNYYGHRRISYFSFQSQSIWILPEFAPAADRI